MLYPIRCLDPFGSPNQGNLDGIDDCVVAVCEQIDHMITSPVRLACWIIIQYLINNIGCALEGLWHLRLHYKNTDDFFFFTRPTMMMIILWIDYANAANWSLCCPSVCGREHRVKVAGLQHEWSSSVNANFSQKYWGGLDFSTYGAHLNSPENLFSQSASYCERWCPTWFSAKVRTVLVSVCAVLFVLFSLVWSWTCRIFLCTSQDLAVLGVITLCRFITPSDPLHVVLLFSHCHLIHSNYENITYSCFNIRKGALRFLLVLSC